MRKNRLTSTPWRREPRTTWKLACKSVVVALVIAAARGCPAGLAQQAETVTIERALQIARESNLDILAARQELEIARGRLVEASYPNRFNPEVGAEAGRRRLGGGRGATDFGVSLSQELEVGGQRGKRLGEARINLDRVEQLIRDQVRLVEADLKKAFFTALNRRQRLDLFRRVEDLNRRLRDASSARVRAGEVPVMEANLAEIRLGQSRKDTLGAERDHAVAILALKQLLSVRPEVSLEPSGDLRFSPSTYDFGDVLACATRTRPDLLAGQREVARVAADAALTRRLVIPNPTIEGFYREEGGAEGRDRIAGGGIRIPLPVFDRRQAELVALAGRRTQARLEVDRTRGAIEQEVAEALRAYESARQESAIFEQDVLARADENFGFIETAFREGKIDLLQLIVVQNDLVAAQFSYLDSLTNLRLAQVDLERAVGVETLEGLGNEHSVSHSAATQAD